jgi:hypothetical protein
VLGTSNANGVSAISGPSIGRAWGSCFVYGNAQSLVSTVGIVSGNASAVGAGASLVTYYYSANGSLTNGGTSNPTLKLSYTAAGGIGVRGSGTVATTPSLVGASFVVNQTGTWSITIPSGKAAGDIVWVVTWTSGGGSVTSSSGMTAVGSFSDLSVNIQTWVRTYQSGDGSSYTFVTGGGGNSVGGIYCASGVSSYDGGTSFNSSSGSTATAPAITPAGQPNIWQAWYSTGFNTITSGPTGATLQASGSNGLSNWYLYDKATTSTGSTGNATATLSGSFGTSYGVMTGVH